MTRRPTIAALVLALALASCGEAPRPETGAAKPADPAGAPTAAAAPAAWSSVDAKGHDWAAQMGSIRFDTDWKAAMARARRSKKPIMFLFTDKTNADVAKLAAVFRDPKVVLAAAAFVPALVDADADAPLAEQYGARMVPMIVYASPEGEALVSTIGATTAADLLNDIQGALDAMKDGAGDEK